MRDAVYNKSTTRKPTQRKLWMRLHGYISIFFFPFALLYTISGALYLWGDLETVEKTKLTLYEISPESPNTIETVQPFLVKELTERNFKVPKGEINQDEDWFVWRTGRSYRAEYRPSSSTAGKGYLRIYRSTFFGRLMDFHKGNGSDWFDYLASAFAALLIGSYLSGVLMAMQIPSMRLGTIIAFTLGSCLISSALYLL